MRHFIVTVFLLAVIAFAAFAGDITGTGMSQGDLYTFLSNVVTTGNQAKTLMTSSRNQPLNVSGFAVEAVGSATFKTTAALSYCVNDALYTFAASSTMAVLTAPTAQVATTSCIYLVTLNAAGAPTYTKGTNVVYAVATPTCPAVPADSCPIAEIKVDLTGAASSFTLGSTANNATGTTVTVTQIRWPRTGTSAITVPSALSLTGL